VSDQLSIVLFSGTDDRLQACSLTMDLFHIEHDDLDPIVDGVEGVASFMFAAGESQIVFI
jgi:peroxiredoxin family protein